MVNVDLYSAIITKVSMLAVGPFICFSELHRDYETVAILPQLGVWWGGGNVSTRVCLFVSVFVSSIG